MCQNFKKIFKTSNDQIDKSKDVDEVETSSSYEWQGKKISNLIKTLKKIFVEKGDLDVCLRDAETNDLIDMSTTIGIDKLGNDNVVVLDDWH